jgi:hypothetical protein
MEPVTLQYNIFVSYSRVDLSLVIPLVACLRIGEGFVFHDVDSIKAGMRWEAEIDTALCGATHFVLFWCRHSQLSAQVRKEYESALQRDKAIVPVLLDSSPVPDALSAYQWIDFRGFVRHGEDQRTPDAEDIQRGPPDSFLGYGEYLRSLSQYQSMHGADSGAEGALWCMVRDLKRAIQKSGTAP